ncbi:MAG: tetratricopeptide repeat protein, partial [Candidatus Heimdallarchaeota archaeon]
LSDKEHLSLLHLKTLWFIELGDFEEAKNSATQLLNRSRKLNDQLRELDAIISLVRVNKKLHNLEEGFEFLQTGKDLLESCDVREDNSIKKMRATLLLQEGILNVHKQNFEQAFEPLMESLTLRRELKDHRGIAECYSHLGFFYKYKGEYPKAVENFRKSLDLNKKIGYKKGIAGSLKSIGGYYLSQGELNKAKEHVQKSLSLIRDLIGDQEETAQMFNLLGIISIYKGELDKALSNFRKSVKIFEDLENQAGRSVLLNNIGQTYSEMGEYQKARDCFEQALEISRQEKKDSMIVEVLFNLIKYFGKSIKPEIISQYLKEMGVISQKHNKDQLVLSQKYRLSQAITLKRSERLADKSKALSLYQQIAQEEMVWFELTVDAMLNLGDLLLYELEVTGKKVVLTEIKELVAHLRNLAEAQQSHWLLAAIYLLESKLALLELDLEKAQGLLTQAEQITVEKGLRKLATTITFEIEEFTSQIEKWKKLISKEASMDERIELTQISSFIERLINRRLYHGEDEIYEYAEEAKEFIAKWRNSGSS